MISAADHALFARLCDGADNIVLVTHINPDGDGLGSQISLVSYLKSIGKHPRIINCDPTHDILQFMTDPAALPEHYDAERHDPVITSADLVLLVDNAVADRLGRMERVIVEVSNRILSIDHHPVREAPWKYAILDEGACATAVMVYELLTATGWTPDLVSARALYVGMATDTGFFRFNSTNAQAHRVAAELIELGVEPASLYGAINERNSEAYTRILGHALKDLRMDAGGAVATVIISNQLVVTLGAGDVDLAEITTSLLAMDGVLVALMFREFPDGKVKVSLRSKGKLNVHLLAGEFGGGGHRNASGILMDTPLERLVELVIDRASAMLATANHDD
jgi:phosphoesterase RecJ-like protein